MLTYRVERVKKMFFSTRSCGNETQIIHNDNGNITAADNSTTATGGNATDAAAVTTLAPPAPAA